MGQVLHGCATTTEAIRRAIQNSQESLRDLASSLPNDVFRRSVRLAFNFNLAKSTASVRLTA
jgi:hypothetical protein